MGFEHITTRRIAEEAGVNIAALHYYFGSKEALLTEAVRYSLGVSAGRLRAVIEAAPTAALALEAAFAEVWNMMREQRAIVRYDLVVRGFRDADARREASVIYDAYHSLTEEIVKKHTDTGGKLAAGLSAEECARYIVSAVDGVILFHIVTGNDAAAQTTLTLIQNHALTLIGAEKEENRSDE